VDNKATTQVAQQATVPCLAAAIRAAVDACPAHSSDLSGGGGDDDADAVAA
jgi:hypothetical protein